MSIYEKNYKSGHPVAGIILGVLGLAAALFLCLLTGGIGGAGAGILGVLALVLGFKARSGGRGIGAIIAGALALILAVTMTLTAFGVIGTIREDAKKAGNAPLIVKYAEKPQLGLMGFFMSAASDGEEALKELGSQLEAFMDQKNAQ